MYLRLNYQDNYLFCGVKNGLGSKTCMVDCKTTPPLSNCMHVFVCVCCLVTILDLDYDTFLSTQALSYQIHYSCCYTLMCLFDVGIVFILAR